MKELIKSTNISKMVGSRNKAVENCLKLLETIPEEHIKFTAYEYPNVFRFETDKEVIIQRIDRHYWRKLLKQLPFFEMLSVRERDRWNEQLEHRVISYGHNYKAKWVPEFTEQNIETQISALYTQKNDFFVDKVDEIFRGVSFNYKNNSPILFKKKLIVNWGYRNSGRDKMNALESVFYQLEGKAVPHCDDLVLGGKSVYRIPYGEHEGDYFKVKIFKNRNMHITFKKLELVFKLNKIIAKKYGETLANKAQ